jgi:uncharacterized protein (PEP-CTERM system associated)
VKSRSLILACGIALWSGASSSAEWTVSKGVSTKLTFTDNSKLSESGGDSSVVGSVTPRISFVGKGARAKVNFAGAVKIDGRGKGSSSINPRVQAKGNTELVENLFFVDGTLRVSQTLINPFLAGSTDSENDSDNVTTTYGYSISPYVKKRLKDYADFQARYTYDQVYHTESDSGEGGSQRFNLSLNSGRKFPKLSWGVEGDIRRNENDNSSNSDFKSADARLGYKFNRSWRATISAGREWNDFDTVQSEDDGTRWDFHAIWTPNPRNSVDFGYGRRFFGSTPSLAFTHRSRRSSFKVGYSRTLTDFRAVFLEQRLFTFTDSVTGAPLIDPATGQPITVLFGVPTLGDSTLVYEHLDASYTLQGKRSTLTIGADQSKQIYQDILDGEQKFLGVRVALDRTLDEKTSAHANVRWQHSEAVSGEEADIATLGVGVSRKLGPRTNLRLDYQRTERDSDVADDSFDENKVMLSLDFDL